MELKKLFTRGFIRIYKLSKLEGKETKSHLGEPVTIYTFRKNGSTMAQSTLVGTIIWNKEVMENLSSEAQELVLSHECSHRDRNVVFKSLLYSTIAWFGIGAWIFYRIAKYLLLGRRVDNLFILIVIAVVLMGVFMALFRIEETLADYHALSKLGEDHFLNAHEEISNTVDRGIISEVIGKVFYTKPKHTVCLFRFAQTFH